MHSAFDLLVFLIPCSHRFFGNGYVHSGEIAPRNNHHHYYYYHCYDGIYQGRAEFGTRERLSGPRGLCNQFYLGDLFRVNKRNFRHHIMCF